MAKEKEKNVILHNFAFVILQKHTHTNEILYNKNNMEEKTQKRWLS